MTRTLRRKPEMAGRTFLLTLGMAVVLFLPFVLFNEGYFIYYGDYNAQQIPFYQLAHDAVRSGEIGWNWYTDLGTNFVGSYSFYLLGSPFFWVTLPFPNDWVPYLMAPLLALKMALAATTAYAYVRRFLQPRLALIAGVLYAFSGFSLYNIFFNHFHEAMIWFPLLLLGIEQYMADGKRGLFAVAVFISALSNYYFFIGQALLVMIYWVVRAPDEAWSHRVRRFFGLWLEALIGVACAAVILLPSFLAVIQNGRTDDPLEGYGLLIHGSPQRLYDIIRSFFFPPDLPARAFFFPNSNNKWASMSAWIPVFGCTGAIAYFQSRRHTDWLRRLLIVLFFCAVIPALNALFQLFNSMYYARWYYMMVLFLILATLRCFQQEEVSVHWPRALGWSGGITAVFAVLVGIVPPQWGPNEETGEWQIGLTENPAYVWYYVTVAVICLLLTILLLRGWHHDRERFYARCTAVCVCVSLVFGWSFLTMGKCLTNYPDDYVIDKLIENEPFALTDSDKFCRTDMYKAMDNQGMYWKQPCIQAFHSIVPGSVMEFYQSVGVERTVASRPNTDRYALRNLLSVRWLFDYAQEDGDIQLYNKEKDDTFATDGVTEMVGWSYYDTQQGFDIYENTLYIPMGFTYTHYITRSEYDDLPEHLRDRTMLKVLVVEDEDVSAIPLAHADIDTLIYTEEQYVADCHARAAGAASAFTTDATGFSASIALSEQTPVFFSVPYETGWSATVNGTPATVYKANVGCMAVMCPAGEDVSIRFTYETPGLRWGAYISLSGIVILLIYLILAWRHNRRPPQSTPAVIEPSAPTDGEDHFDLYQIYRPNNQQP